MDDDNFDWRDEKAVTNLKKHKISFEQAKGAFSDPFAFEFIDDSEHYGEERYVLIGMSEGRLLYVVYTERDGRDWIISARLATAHERKRYHEENSQA